MRIFFLSILSICLISCKSGKKETTATPSKGDSLTATTDNTAPDNSGTDSVDLKSLGDIALEQHYLETLKALGNPDQKSKAVEWGADGLMHEDWTWTSKGLVLNMSAEKSTTTSNLYVFSITATEPCTLKTKAGIGIGSSYEEITTAYKRHINSNESTKEQVTIGSVYGGIIFTLTNNKVTSIFLGAAAE